MPEMKIDHWCAVCGRGYHACDSCAREKAYTSWRTITDTMEHYKIFMILRDYNAREITGEKAAALLEELDLSGWQNFKPGARRTLESIFPHGPSAPSAQKLPEYTLGLPPAN